MDNYFLTFSKNQYLVYQYLVVIDYIYGEVKFVTVIYGGGDMDGFSFWLCVTLC